MIEREKKETLCQFVLTANQKSLRSKKTILPTDLWEVDQPNTKWTYLLQFTSIANCNRNKDDFLPLQIKKLIGWCPVTMYLNTRIHKISWEIMPIYTIFKIQCII